jgi:hypothetical protein
MTGADQACDTVTGADQRCNESVSTGPETGVSGPGPRFSRSTPATRTSSGSRQLPASAHGGRLDNWRRQARLPQIDPTSSNRELPVKCRQPPCRPAGRPSRHANSRRPWSCLRPGAVREPKPLNRRPTSAGLPRLGGVALAHASSATCSSAAVANTVLQGEELRPHRLMQPLDLPVVVGE